MVIGTPTVLNLIPGKVFPVVNVNQYDAGYQKTFLLYKGAEPFNIATNMSVTIRGTKGDRNGIADSAAHTVGSNLIAVTLTEQMTAVAGPNIYELRIVDTDGLLVGTVNFVMMVEPAALGDGTVISDSDLDYAADVLDRLQGVEAFKNEFDALSDAFDLKTGSAGYYDEVTATTGKYTNADGYSSTYYLATVPMNDSEGNQITIYSDYDRGTTPLIHAQKDYTTLTTNSSLDFSGDYPAVIHNGQIAREASFTSYVTAYPFAVYVGFGDDRVPREFPITTSAQDMINAGIKEASVAYYRLVTNGVARDVSNIGLPASNLNANPRMAMFTKSDGSVCFLAVDGRENVDEGLKPSELAALMIQLGAVQGWNLDGGGSSSLVLKGSKYNRNIDNDGTADRGISVTWNVGHKFSNTAVQQSFSNIGVEKQRVIQQIIPYVQSGGLRVKTRVALLDLDAGSYYINNATDSPTSLDDGFAIVQKKFASLSHVTKVFWMPWASPRIYENIWTGAEWSGWKTVDVYSGLYENGSSINSGDDLNNYVAVGNYYVASSAIAETLSNTPYTGQGFRLLVMRQGTTGIRQIAIPNTGARAQLATRLITISGSSTTYDDWEIVRGQKTITATGTTNENGNIVLNDIGAASFTRVLSVSVHGYLAIPFATTANRWAIQILNTTQREPMVNKSVEYVVTYLN